MLKAPFPYFGGKSTVAVEVWRRFGDVPNYVEPFFGSGAVLLRRPAFDGNRIETVNDLDGHIANFWRALQADPAEVARYADWPVSELDLHARGDWLFYRPDVREWVERLRADPDYYDAKSAGWWVWFVSCWIGPLPAMGGTVARQMPHLGNAGKGGARQELVARQMPELRSGTSGIRSSRAVFLSDYLRKLADRLNRVRVCCGDWSRVTGPSVTFKHGITAVFLDPPYNGDERQGNLYSTDSHTVAADVREWAIANGDNPLMRIALCGYDTEHVMPDSWQSHTWKANGGYGSQGNGRGRANSAREVIWFSPSCLNPIDTMPLFAHANGKAAPP